MRLTIKILIDLIREEKLALSKIKTHQLKKVPALQEGKLLVESLSTKTIRLIFRSFYYYTLPSQIIKNKVKITKVLSEIEKSDFNKKNNKRFGFSKANISRIRKEANLAKEILKAKNEKKVLEKIFAEAEENDRDMALFLREIKKVVSKKTRVRLMILKLNEKLKKEVIQQDGVFFFTLCIQSQMSTYRIV